MKTLPITVAAVVCSLLITTGCNQTEPSGQADPAQTESSDSTEAGGVQAVMDTAKEQMDQARENIEQATDKVQAAIETAKKHIAEGKWSDALALLDNLSGQELSSEQQSLVESLKQQVKKAMEAAAASSAKDEASKAVGGLLQQNN